MSKTSRNNHLAELLNIETYLRIRDLPNGCNSIFMQTSSSDTIRYKKDKESCNHGNGGLLATIPSNGLFKKLDQNVNNPQKESYFTCHRVFNEKDGQDVVYKNVALPIVQDALKGFTCTIFAYGQTGSGKTYTMQGVIGDQIEEGIISRAIRDIFQHFSNLSSDDDNVIIKVSYCEIYNERILDLLRNSAKQEETFQVMVSGRICTKDKQKSLMQKNVKNAEAAFECLKTGNLKRNVGSTKMNEESSRSHAIFQIQIEQEKLDAPKKIIGKLFLVDLAGSENANSGGNLTEARNIKFGLNTLDRVINALHAKKPFIPHSSSQLTRFLKESLGGNSRTAFIICCSPASCNYTQTYSTLDFGSRVKNIENKKQINVEWTAEKLKEKVVELEEKLRKSGNQNKIEIHDEEKLNNLRMKIEEMEVENEMLKMDLQEAEQQMSKLAEENLAITELRAENGELNKKNKKLIEEIIVLKEQMGKLAEKLAKLPTIEQHSEQPIAIDGHHNGDAIAGDNAEQQQNCGANQQIELQMDVPKKKKIKGRTKYAEELRRAVVDAKKCGFTSGQIRKIFNLSEQTVKNFLRLYGGQSIPFKQITVGNFRCAICGKEGKWKIDDDVTRYKHFGPTWFCAKHDALAVPEKVKAISGKEIVYNWQEFIIIEQLNK